MSPADITPDEWAEAKLALKNLVVLMERLEDAQRAIEEVVGQVHDMSIVVSGRPSQGVLGLVQKTTALEKEGEHTKKVLEEMANEKKRQKAILVGIGIGIGLNVLTGGATLLTVIQALNAVAGAGGLP